MSRITILIGDYGSGKTEVSINLAQALAQEGNKKVALVDLDVINPYFRSREAEAELLASGVEVIFPSGAVAQADLPVISPAVFKVLQNKDYTAIFDVGGEELGAKVLGSLYNYLKNDDYAMALVVNNNRPFTKDLAGLVAMKEAIERASRLTVNALVANPNLGNDTTSQIIEEGYLKITGFAQELNLPLLFTAVSQDLLADVSIATKILPLKRYMKQPW